MDAPGSAYKQTGGKYDTYDYTNGTNTYRAFIAKFLYNTSTGSGDGYYNQGEDLNTIITKLKSLFYLDDVQVIWNENNYAVGWIGLVRSGSDNANMHNSSTSGGKYNRFFGEVINNGTQNLIMLNDAGLNTKSIATTVSVTSASGGTARINDYVLNYSIKSSFWGGTSGGLIEITQSATDTDITITDMQSVPAKTTRQVMSEPLHYHTSIRAKTQFFLSVQSINNEGLSPTPSTIAPYLEPAVWSMRYGTTRDNSITGPLTTVYADMFEYQGDYEIFPNPNKNNMLGAKLFTTNALTTEATYGYYYMESMRRYFQFSYNALTDRTEIWDSGTYVPPAAKPSISQSIITEPKGEVVFVVVSNNSAFSFTNHPTSPYVNIPASINFVISSLYGVAVSIDFYLSNGTTETFIQTSTLQSDGQLTVNKSITVANATDGEVYQIIAYIN